MDVKDLTEDEPDASGIEVEEIYVRNAPDYAVYRTARRVMIQFADKAETAEAQRKALAPLGPLRSQIDGMLADWSKSRDDYVQAKARRYQLRSAMALEVGLQSDPEGAAKLLEEIRDQVLGHRTARARFQYLVAAGGGAGVTFLLIWIATLLVGGGLCRTPLPAAALIDGVLGGTIGAFFSIATGLLGRTVLTDLSVGSNRSDALLRMMIGSIAGGVLVCLIVSGTLTAITFDTAKLTGTDALQLLAAGFVAGFSERLVPDLLAKASLASPAGNGKDAAAEAAAKAKAVP